jgi:uncharacterized alpha-E superfamily protein
MLSRTADHLYWMSRYTERAENIARLVDVTYRMSLQRRDRPYWGAALGINGLESQYKERHDTIEGHRVMRFMVLDVDHPSSILGALKSARENCHAVRGTVTSEVWETINSTWLEARDRAAELMQGGGQGSELAKFFEWVKFRSHLSRGVTVGTMLQDEAFQFIRLGTFLERADNTARILDVKFDELAPRPESTADASTDSTDYYEWSSLLRSVSGFEIYRKVYRDAITPSRVAELLILREDMPRSIHACVREVHAILLQVANTKSKETERRAGALYSHFRYSRIEDVLAVGLHDYLTDVLERTADLGNRISTDFLI